MSQCPRGSGVDNFLCANKDVSVPGGETTLRFIVYHRDNLTRRILSMCEIFDTFLVEESAVRSEFCCTRVDSARPGSLRRRLYVQTKVPSPFGRSSL